MKGIYPKITFKVPENRPLFYSNFVSTLDGKVQVTTKDTQKYWPIGSQMDYATLYQLRGYADVLVHGKNTALEHGAQSIAGLEKINKKIIYLVLSNHIDQKLIDILKTKNRSVEVYIVATESSQITYHSEKQTNILKFGQKEIDLKVLADYLYSRNLKHVLVEGGPHVLGSFLKAGLLDEVFLTLAPKIFGNQDNQTLTMAEGYLFKPEDVPEYSLISVKHNQDEVYLRYRIKNDRYTD